MAFEGQGVVVLGGGSWGTALAQLLAHAGHTVTLLVRDPVLAMYLNENHENPRYLSGVTLHPNIHAVAVSVGEGGAREKAAADKVRSDASTLATLLADTRLLLLSVPCQVMRATLQALAVPLSTYCPHCVLVNTAKGIEVSERVTVERMIQEELPAFLPRYAVLSGPSFALEVAQRKPTAVVLGCRDDALGSALRDVFATPWFRAYSSVDVTGVELGGAIKNIIAIAAGLSDGLGFGLNARAALVTRGLAETSRLGVALGANPATFMGLSGLGDLMLTCSGDLSRNRQVGMRLGAGESLAAIAASMRMVAEGVKTTEAVHTLALAHGVDMPVTRAMYGVLYEALPPRAAVQSLMERQLRKE
ncbi:MAG: NAD(P)H-dependent glycerol-3-phosphate dehydrogenase [Bilophila sp.]